MKRISIACIALSLQIAPALQAMSAMRNFKARVALMAQLAKPRIYTFNTGTSLSSIKFTRSKGSSHGTGHGHSFSYTKAVMPVLSVGLFYEAYDKLMLSFGFAPSLTSENIEKYPEHLEQFIQKAHSERLDSPVVQALIKKCPELALRYEKVEDGLMRAYVLNRTAGFIHYNSYDISWLHVEAQYRNQGIASELLKQALADIQIRNEEKLNEQDLEVTFIAMPFGSKRMQLNDLIQFYEKRGAQVNGGKGNGSIPMKFVLKKNVAVEKLPEFVDTYTICNP